MIQFCERCAYAPCQREDLHAPRSMTIDVPADDCERCPFFHDEANACEASDMRELEGAYARRPDWCPLDKGPVLVQVRK